MGKLIYLFRQARLAYSVKVSRSVPVSEVAREIGVSRTFLSNVEHGKTWPSQKVVEGLCRVYGVKPGALFDYGDTDGDTPEAAK